MPEKIAKANIEHFKKLLETKTDAKKRAMIERLLAEEELKLAALKKRRSERKRTDGLIPLAPVRWVHIHRRMCARVHPAAKHAAAWKDNACCSPSASITANSRSRSNGADAMSAISCQNDQTILRSLC